MIGFGAFRLIFGVIVSLEMVNCFTRIYDSRAAMEATPGYRRMDGRDREIAPYDDTRTWEWQKDKCETDSSRKMSTCFKYYMCYKSNLLVLIHVQTCPPCDPAHEYCGQPNHVYPLEFEGPCVNSDAYTPQEHECGTKGTPRPEPEPEPEPDDGGDTDQCVKPDPKGCCPAPSPPSDPCPAPAPDGWGHEPTTPRSSGWSSLDSDSGERNDY